MNIEEFYNQPVLFNLPAPITFLLEKGFLRELTNSGLSNWQTLQNLINKEECQPKVEIQVHKALQSNLNSIMPVNQWILASVWFLNEPVMILRNADYYPGDRYPKHFITDTTLHKQMVYYIFSFMEEDRRINNSSVPFELYKYRIFPNRVLEKPQEIIQPDVYNLELAELAINL